MDALLQKLEKSGRPFSSFTKGDTIHVSNKMSSKKYSYILTESPGINLNFKPYADPGEMLALGVFEGKYINDCVGEFPAEWYLRAISLGKLSPEKADETLNLFKIYSRQSLSIWKENGWVPPNFTKKHPILSDSKQNPDERGWFQWYCRYWMGRRIPVLDDIQIKRWNAFKRHAGAIRKNCPSGDVSCRPRQRQALIQWAHDPFL